MRRSRRGLSGGHEFGGSGEDSFVAVVVTKLTGALLFILLLTMVIMALIPKADEAGRPRPAGEGKPATLRIATPESLPEAIAGRPYNLALAAEGASGPLTWAVDGGLPEGLSLDPSTGLIHGTPKKGTPKPSDLVVRATDGSAHAASRVTLTVYQADTPLTTPSRWKPSLPPVPWRAWMEQGFGFLVLLLVVLVGQNVVSALERVAAARSATKSGRGRFLAYRAVVWGSGLASAAALAFWLWRGRVG